MSLSNRWNEQAEAHTEKTVAGDFVSDAVRTGRTEVLQLQEQRCFCDNPILHLCSENYTVANTRTSFCQIQNTP